MVDWVVFYEGCWDVVLDGLVWSGGGSERGVYMVRNIQGEDGK